MKICIKKYQKERKMNEKSQKMCVLDLIRIYAVRNSTHTLFNMLISFPVLNKTAEVSFKTKCQEARI